MGSTTIRLEEDVYERLRTVKREDESFSEAVARLLGGGSLLDLASLWSPAEVDELREVLKAVDEDAVTDTATVAGRIDPE